MKTIFTILLMGFVSVTFGNEEDQSSASLKGDLGATGPQGPECLPGPQGPPLEPDQGLKGGLGATGLQGPECLPGPQGPLLEPDQGRRAT